MLPDDASYSLRYISSTTSFHETTIELCGASAVSREIGALVSAERGNCHGLNESRQGELLGFAMRCSKSNFLALATSIPRDYYVVEPCESIRYRYDRRAIGKWETQPKEIVTGSEEQTDRKDTVTKIMISG